MWIHHYTKMYKGISPEDIWKIWTNVAEWKNWFTDVQESRVQGQFSVNSFFSLRFNNETPITYRITKIFEGYKFVSIRKLWGATLYDTRAIDTSTEGVRLIRTVSLDGPLAWFWKYKISKEVFYKTSLELECLVLHARKAQYSQKSLSAQNTLSEISAI